MKSAVFISAVLSILILGSLAVTSTAATDLHKQKAVRRFDSPVILQGVVLKGKYLFVHDDEAMARGEACSYVYKGEGEKASNLVASFHCIHVDRTKAKHFIVRTGLTPSGTVELLEFQFKGETTGHAVPTSQKVEVVPLGN